MEENANIDANVRRAIQGFNRNRLDPQERPVGPASGPTATKKQPARKVSRDTMSNMSDAELAAAIKARKQKV